MAGLEPPADFSERDLVLSSVESGRCFGRILGSKFPNPLGYGQNGSRFSDPRDIPPDERFGVLYLGTSLKVCFVETIIRDRGIGAAPELLLDEQELRDRNYAEVETASPLTVVDLRGDGPIVMRIPSDVAGGSGHTLSQVWSLAFHEHPSRPDGIIYASRYNEETNLAVYDRGVAKLRARRLGPLLAEEELGPILRDLKIAIY